MIRYGANGRVRVWDWLPSTDRSSGGRRLLAVPVAVPAMEAPTGGGGAWCLLRAHHVCTPSVLAKEHVVSISRVSLYLVDTAYTFFLLPKKVCRLQGWCGCC